MSLVLLIERVIGRQSELEKSNPNFIVNLTSNLSTMENEKGVSSVRRVL